MMNREKTDMKWFRNRLEAERERKAAQLAAARKDAEVSGKEPFDFKKLCKLIDLTPELARPGWEPTIEFLEACEYKYYVQCQDLMTLKDFARYLEMMDSENH